MNNETRSEIKELVKQALREKEFNDLIFSRLFDVNNNVYNGTMNNQLKERCRAILRDHDFTNSVQPIVINYLRQHLEQNVKSIFFDSCQPQIRQLVDAALLQKLSSEERFRQLLSEMEKRFHDALQHQQRDFQSAYSAQRDNIQSLTDSEIQRHRGEINRQAEQVVQNMSSLYLRHLEDKNKELESRMINLLNKQQKNQDWWNYGLMFGVGLGSLIGGLGLAISLTWTYLK